MKEKTAKCVFVGDGMVGKTSLILRLKNGNSHHLNAFVPTVLDRYEFTATAGDDLVTVEVWDVADQPEYALLRRLSYTNTDVFLVCYAVDSFSSYENARDLWIPEVRHFCPNAQILLVGTKTDLRTDIMDSGAIGRRILLSANGELMARQVNAGGYLECSVLTGEGVEAIFEAATRLALFPKEHTKSHKCSVM